MRAAVVGTDPTAPPLDVRDVPDPEANGDRVVVRLKRAALNRLDAMMLETRTDEAPGSIFGSDGAGTVAALGPDVKSGVAVGDEVIIAPSLHWGADERVPGADYEILGSPTNGTHAQLVAVPAANVHRKPAHLSWEEAAALPLAGVTAWRALISRGRLARGETVVIAASSSGVGSLAIQIAAATGAHVVAVTSSGDKAQDAIRLGASSVVDRTSPTFSDDLRQATGGEAHLALDPTGAFWQAFADVLRPGGRLIIVGQMATPAGELRVQSVYWKQLDVLGSSMGSPADFAALLDHVSAHGWSPRVDSVYPLSRISDAYARLDARDRVGKVVLDVE